MKKNINEGFIDRIIRLLISIVLLIGVYFWLSGVLAIIFYILGIFILLTAITGFCGIYKIFGINTLYGKNINISKYFKIIIIFLLFIIFVVGSYLSHFFTKKIFLNDYARMNNHYKQTLFYTGQNNRDESISNYIKLVAEYNIFQKKYSSYHPHVLKSDLLLNSDLEKISGIISSLDEGVYSGDLEKTHIDFESIRPIFQDILIRNNFSMLAVVLVSFHDSMEEIIIAADSKDLIEAITVYADVDIKLKEVEAIANDEEIKKIREKLEKLLSLAKKSELDSLPSKAAELKSAFVKVYLKRG